MAVDQHGNLISAGGRVLTVVGLGSDLEAARDRAYASIAQIRLEGSFYRRDIAAAAVYRRAGAAGAARLVVS
jgi:phosphoribosylamine--glycine ligase